MVNYLSSPHGFKFTELSPEAKKVAVSEFMIDAKEYEFGEEGQDDPVKVAEMLAKPSEKHRYDEQGIVIGQVKYYYDWHSSTTKEVFTEGGMY